MSAIEREQGAILNNPELMHLRNDFYQDGFRAVLLSIVMIVAAIALLIIVSLYFFLHQVLPISFPVYPGWRVQPDVAVDQPYLHISDLVQWVSSAMPKLFASDFVNYDLEIKQMAIYFTTNGWAKYATVLNTYVNRDDVMRGKLFISATAGGAPVVLNQGLVDGKYAWWVQMPLNVRYSGADGASHEIKLQTQTLVVRVPTLNNLDGVGIENMIVSKG